MEIEYYLGEIWLPIKGYEGLYDVSNFGRVRSVDRIIYKTSKNGKLYSSIRKGVILSLKPNEKRNNYVEVGLCKEGVRTNLKVHRLVAIAFIPNPENKPDIDHIDGNPLNNNASNLRWVTKSENMKNPITVDRLRNSIDREKRGERMKGDLNPSRRFSFTEERRKAISDRCKGKKHRPESIEKMKQAAKGRYLGALSTLSKSVAWYDSNNNAIGKYGGMREAQRETGINRAIIRESILNNKRLKDGSYWKCI